MSYNPNKPVDLAGLKAAIQKVGGNLATAKKDAAAAIAAANHLRPKKVDSIADINLTAEDADRYLYLIPKTGATGGDRYSEYVVVDGALEQVGGSASGADEGYMAVSFVIPASGWASDGTSGYPYYYDLEIPGLTANDEVPVTPAPSGMAAAVASGMCSLSESMDGKLRLRSARAPDVDIAAEYRLKTGETGGHALPLATADQAGAVKPGAGLKVEDGVLSLDTASDAEVDEMLAEVLSSDDK